MTIAWVVWDSFVLLFEKLSKIKKYNKTVNLKKVTNILMVKEIKSYNPKIYNKHILPDNHVNEVCSSCKIFVQSENNKSWNSSNEKNYFDDQKNAWNVFVLIIEMTFYDGPNENATKNQINDVYWNIRLFGWKFEKT